MVYLMIANHIATNMQCDSQYAVRVCAPKAWRRKALLNIARMGIFGA